MAFGVYEDVSVVCLSRSWFVYAPFLMGLARSRPSDSGGRRRRKRHSPQFPPVLFSCLRFFNSADPTISESGTGYHGVKKPTNRLATRRTT